jgi:hypothetical protein
MLDILRRNSRHWLVIALMAIVVVGLTLFFGYSSRDMGGGATWAAKVGGDTIKMGEFLTRYRNVVENYKRKFGPDFDEKLLEPLNIKFQILSGMVTDRIVEKEAKNDGIGVSSLELRDLIAQIPYFQKDGVFSMDYYKGMLAYNRMTASEFEEIQRREVIREKLGDIIMNSYKVSDEELREAYIMDKQGLRLSYIKLNKDDAVNDASNDATNAQIEKAMATNDIKQAAKILKASVKGTDKFTRKDFSIPGITGSNTNDVLWSFGITAKKLYTREMGSDTYIILSDGADRVSFETKGKIFEDFKRDYMSQKASQVFIAYIDELKRKWSRKIDYSPAVMGMDSPQNN